MHKNVAMQDLTPYPLVKVTRPLPHQKTSQVELLGQIHVLQSTMIMRASCALLACPTAILRKLNGYVTIKYGNSGRRRKE